MPRLFFFIASEDYIAPRPRVNRTIILQSLGGYALMNPNTTKEAPEAKMDHTIVISIKKGQFKANSPISRTAPLRWRVESDTQH